MQNIAPQGELVLEGADEYVIPLTTDGRRKRRPNLSVEEAQDLTTEIQKCSVRLWILVVEAHDRQAHTAMGYEKWADYCKAELKMSESRSYQLLDTGHVMKELATAGVDLETQEPPPARVVAGVKDRLATVRKVAAEALGKGESVNDALRDLAKKSRPAASTRRDDDPVENDDGDDDTVQGEVVSTPTIPEQAGPTNRGREVSASSEGWETCPSCHGTGVVAPDRAVRLQALEVLVSQ